MIRVSTFIGVIYSRMTSCGIPSRRRLFGEQPACRAFHAGLVPGGHQLATAQAELTGRLKLVQLPSLHPLKYPVLFQFPCVETYL